MRTSARRGSALVAIAMLAAGITLTGCGGGDEEDGDEGIVNQVDEGEDEEGGDGEEDD